MLIFSSHFQLAALDKEKEEEEDKEDEEDEELPAAATARNRFNLVSFLV